MSDSLARTWDPLLPIRLPCPVSQSRYKGICPVLVHLVMQCSVGILGGQLSSKRKWKSNNSVGEGKWGVLGGEERQKVQVGM